MGDEFAVGVLQRKLKKYRKKKKLEQIVVKVCKKNDKAAAIKKRNSKETQVQRQHANLESVNGRSCIVLCETRVPSIILGQRNTLVL